MVWNWFCSNNEIIVDKMTIIYVLDIMILDIMISWY